MALSPKAMLVVGEACSIQYLWQKHISTSEKNACLSKKIQEWLIHNVTPVLSRCFVLFKNYLEEKAKIIRESYSLNSYCTSQHLVQLYQTSAHLSSHCFEKV